MNRNLSIESRGLALGALAAGIACALGAVVVIAVVVLVHHEADRLANPDVLRTSWQAVYESFARPWLPTQPRVTQGIITLVAVCILWSIGRHPIVSLPIHPIDETDDDL